MPQNAILTKMLDRLYTSLMRGPSLNCRPQSSRQRVDLTSLAALEDVDPSRVLPGLLGAEAGGRRVRIAANVPMPVELQRENPFESRRAEAAAQRGERGGPTPTEPEHVRRWRRQKSVLTKLRAMSEEARTYEQDTGVHALHVGFPMLCVPPRGVGKRVIAPIAFVPVTLEVSVGRKPGVDIACCGEGVDLVTPNEALMAWLERESGKTVGEMFGDEEGEDPWREIGELIATVGRLMELDVMHAAAWVDQTSHKLATVPAADDLPNEAVLMPGAVLGLFPAANQGLIRDTQAMIAAPALGGPVMSFVDVAASLDAPAEHEAASAEATVKKERRRFVDERFVAQADPCQARAVELARTQTGLVVHGPPGTGKSQTITNIIGDHLSRGLRVLFVCDKRTALDVVANRLEHIGLGGLCAVVHDPQRDQRDFYMALRGRLESLPEAKTWPRAEAELDKADAELQQLHDELTAAHAGLMLSGDRDASGRSLHEMMGQWLAIGVDDATAAVAEATRQTPIADLETHRRDIEVVLDRATAVGMATNPWAAAAGVSLDAFMARPVDSMRRGLASCVEHARAADATADPLVPPFDPTRSLADQAAERVKLADQLEKLRERGDAKAHARVAAMTDEQVKRLSRALADVASYRATVAQGPLDRELLLGVRERLPSITAISQHLTDLGVYLGSARKWYAALAFGGKAAGVRATRAFGLMRTPDDAERLRTFLLGLRARIVLSDVWAQVAGLPEDGALADDAALGEGLGRYEQAMAVRAMADGVAELRERVIGAMTDGEACTGLVMGLRRSGPRAEALATLEQSLTAIDLLSPKWIEQARAAFRGGKRSAETMARLEQRFDDIESVLRVRDGLAALPPSLRRATAAAVEASADTGDALAAMHKGALTGAIGSRIAGDPRVSRLDAQRLSNAFDRYGELEDRKRELVRRAIVNRWITRQRERLIVGTGSRLNSLGADLRRRLFVRGKRAMRLRQVLAVGRGIEGGDPLLDMCPVWMASPEAVAQVFDHDTLFDVVIFDEASQCRLEEALPVLMRAKRVVIAGDPKQLPPTRFFEAAIATSEADDPETDQDLFEMQQGEVEDLLAAALNLNVDESYLDVHYRSRNADLIEFSNAQFYHNRLQSIPGHPANRARFAPITLHRVDGVYEERSNPAEAAAVCDLVRDLLRRADPPSIGIACFNITQRDLISEMLDERAAADDEFARRLAAARTRRGEGSYEGLFVKNLENVQGDERDHIIICTTYGPTAEGRFYRRFGPLGSAGGGRRLNVLVTRARHEVHLITSIPAEVYRSVDTIPEGAAPNGAWLLFAYLRYAEQLAGAYEENHRVLEATAAQPAAERQPAMLIERAIEPVSAFARAVAQRLVAERGIGANVHWGNAGFCVDAALHHPLRADDVTIGVMCDFNRFPHARDPVEWEVFRGNILKWTGWTIQRVWSPDFFRDPQRSLNQIEQAAGQVAAPSDA